MELVRIFKTRGGRWAMSVRLEDGTLVAHIATTTRLSKAAAIKQAFANAERRENILKGAPKC